ncbi:hypothetical protein GCM10007881_55400 [Mesorhizobium huakuii]|uniref:hypothetical protein n=1 Tax=Mesorhizobium huakuii TaxID=28104 RepID=UPI00235D539F|nr:hypothetical protein [Mesorhizobium huakuii]GLQ82019.1 hypothetical protein GCM10007881_55400 [Mesorhizobium huakuii]
MRLAPDIVIAHGGNVVRLRPSLRAAVLLENQHGLGKIVKAIGEGDFNIVLDIITAATDNPAAYRILVKRVEERGYSCLFELADELTRLVAASFGIDADVEPEKPREKAGKEFSIEAGLEQFFEIGTGWLGWSPADTWAATPAEIIVAQRGLVAKLKAIHGSAEDNDKPEHDPREPVSPQEVREGIATLRALSRQAQ